MSDVDDGWIACLVLVVAPEPYAAQVTAATCAAERTIFSDPVLVDLARVAASAPGTLDADPNRIAARLHRELVTWARSPARNPAPRCTFCVLLLHPDASEAELLVQNLATTAALSELPIVFRIGGLPTEPDSPEAEGQSNLTRMILESITATAHEVDRTPDFSLRVGQISAAVTRQGPVPAPAPWPQEPDVAEERAEHEDSTPVRQIEEPRDVVHQKPDVPRQSVGRAAVERVVRFSGALLDRLTQRGSPPASNLEVINDLSGRANRVSMLYLVFVAEPVRPSKQGRQRRAEIALELTRTLLSGADPSGETWYVRAFTAGRELRAGRPLSEPERLRHKDFPGLWGEYFDLYDSVGDVLDSIAQNTSSFVRRGIEPPRTTVVFLAETAPRNEAGAAERLADLSQAAEIVWVSFGRSGPVPEEFEPVSAHFLRYHEDFVEELLDLVVVRPEFEPDSAGEERVSR